MNIKRQFKMSDTNKNKGIISSNNITDENQLSSNNTAGKYT